MKRIVLIMAGFLLLNHLMAQNKKETQKKPPLDFSSEDWSYVEHPAISNDGKYVLYKIGNQPVGSNTLIIESTREQKKKAIEGLESGFFSCDSKQVFFMRNDSLFFLSLVNGNMRVVAGIKSYKQPEANKGEWLVYQLDSPSKQWVLENLLTGKKQSYDSVESCFFDPSGKVLLLIRGMQHENQTVTSLDRIDLSNRELRKIWSVNSSAQIQLSIDKCSFDESGKQLVFLVNKKGDKQSEHSIFYYKVGMEQARMLLNDESPALGSGSIYPFTSIQFSRNGKHIFFQLQEKERIKTSRDAAPVDVWSYKDSVLQSTQLIDLKRLHLSYVTMNPENDQLIQIAGVDDYFNTNSFAPGDFGIVSDQQAIAKQDQYWWKPQPSHFLVSLNDGSRKLLSKEYGDYNSGFNFSPRGKWLVYYDQHEHNYVSYDLSTGTTVNISGNISEPLTIEFIKGGMPGHADPPVGVAGWITGDSSVLVYDEFDIWQLDPKGKTAPIDITNGYGRSHHIRFRLVEEENALKEGVSGNTSLLLTALDAETKYNGFYKKQLNKKGDPELLSMGPYKFYLTQSQRMGRDGLQEGVKPLKAKTNAWIVGRQSASEFGNYFYTTDFKRYVQLSNVQPQAGCNWLTSELMNWKLPDGTISQGILYKPFDFNKEKKYPIILNYYQERSCDVFEFPDYYTDITADINIPWFVSRGYLVFEPDIHYEVGNVAKSVVNSVVSAAKYLGHLPFVDSSKMGITGHSFGGSETNYLVTHTHLFAAAAEGSGGADLISGSLRLLSDRLGGGSSMGVNERGQGRMGATLWQVPDSVILNTPVLQADKVTTPLLIMHNKKDDNVAFEQGLELFIALRRLGKKVWMLQYDDGTHGMIGKSANDYIIRMQQYFDHYLKGAPAPVWMTKGIPATLKGIETGYAYDPSNNCGKNCKVCQYWNENFQKDSAATLKEIEAKRKSEYWQ